MSTFTKIIRSTVRQLFILTMLVGLTFAAGIKWAEAAGTGAGAEATGAMPSEIHVIFLFLLTLGVMAHMVIKPQQRARIRARPQKRRTARR